MTSVVDGWWNTKKRGRDDEAIERDRREALARRKRIRKAWEAPTRTVDDTIPSVSRKCRRNNSQSAHSPSSWVKPPCEHPLHRSHRRRKPRYAQRELFPQRESKNSRRKRPQNIQSSIDQKENPRRLCERCRNAIEPAVGQPKPTRCLHTKATKDSGNCNSRKQNRGRVVTPSKQDTRLKSPRRSTLSASHRAHQHKSKILDFGEVDLSRVPSLVNAPRQRSRHGQKQSDCHVNAVARQKSPRPRQKPHQLGPEPDFARSARCLYETIRRRKRVRTRKDTSLSCMGESMVEKREDVIVAAARSMSSAIARIKHASQEHQPKVQQCGPHYKTGTATAKPPSVRLESSFRVVRDLLLGNSHTTDFDKCTEDGRNNALEARETTELLTVKKDSTLSSGCNNSSEAEMNVERKESHELQQLGTQQESVSFMTQDNPPEDIHQRQQTAGGRNGKAASKLGSVPQEGISMKNDATSDPLLESKESRNDFLSLHSCGETNGVNASPSQTPSTSSSALLSLPMNDLFAWSQRSGEQSESKCIVSNPKMSSRTQSQGPTPGGDHQPGIPRKKQLDPLIDIEFWQQILEREDRQAQIVGSSSFKHSLARLVVAKNSSSCNNDGNHHKGGFLWLPSILEGGLKQTGLLEDGSSNSL